MNKLLGSTAVALFLAGAATVATADDATDTSRSDPITGDATTTGAAPAGATITAPADDGSSGNATETSRTDPLTGADRTSEPFVHAGYSETDSTQVLEGDLDDAKVYGRNDETIGTITSVMVGTDGVITDAVIDVGGILGIGAHSVMVPYSDLKVLQEDGGDKIRVYSDSTKAELEAMPAHAG